MKAFMAPLRIFQSMGLIPAAVTRIRIWPSPGWGSAHSSYFSLSGPPYSCSTTAFITKPRKLCQFYTRFEGSVGTHRGYLQDFAVGAALPMINDRRSCPGWLRLGLSRFLVWVGFYPFRLIRVRKRGRSAYVHLPAEWSWSESCRPEKAGYAVCRPPCHFSSQ